MRCNYIPIYLCQLVTDLTACTTACCVGGVWDYRGVRLEVCLRSVWACTLPDNVHSHSGSV